MKCEGEYESLKAIHAISPGFVPEPFAWGKCHNKEPEACFLLEEFRDIRDQVGPLDLLFQPRLPIQLSIARRPGQTRKKTCQNVAWGDCAGCRSMG